MAETVLTYFEGRGRAQVLRLTLCMTGVKFTEKYVHSEEEFQDLKKTGKLLFSEMPILEIDGMIISQTNAILRYLGRRAGITPTDAKQAVKVDELCEGAQDFLFAFMPIGLGLMGPDDVVLAKAKTKVAKYLPVFEKELESTATGFVVGSQLTLADFTLLCDLLSIVDYFGEDSFDAYRNIKKFFAKMKDLPEAQHYLNTVRHRKNDEKYAKEVLSVINP